MSVWAWPACIVLLLIGCAHSGTERGGAIDRPDRIGAWPTLGVTVRTSADNPAIPAQLRHIQIDPDAYEHLISTGSFPDGATLSATFYPVAFKADEEPPLYHAEAEAVFLALEVIDREHPDGRRFYAFAPGAKTASPLPAGNACAACHNAHGTLDGAFAHLYPLTARLKPAPEKRSASG